MVPNLVLRDSSLSCTARLLYAVLKSYSWQTGQCWPKQETLMQDLGVGSDHTLRAALRELQHAGLVEVKRRRLGKPNLYTVKEPVEQADEGPASLDQGSRHADSAPTETHPCAPTETQSTACEEETEKNTQGILRRVRLHPGLSAKELTTRTVGRTREVGLEPSREQINGWAAGWRDYLSAEDSPSEQQANRILVKIVAAAAGELSKNGCGFVLSVQDAAKRIEAPKSSAKSEGNGHPPKPEDEPSSTAVQEAFRKADIPRVRKLWELSLEWDFTRDRRPPWPVWSVMGSSDEERLKLWKQMKRIAQKVSSQEAA